VAVPPAGLPLDTPRPRAEEPGLALGRGLRERLARAGIVDVAVPVAASDGSVGLDGALWRALDLMGADLASSAEAEQEQLRLMYNVAELGSAAMMAGFLTWFLRGGTLLTSLLSSLPLWTRMDPLPVLNVAPAGPALLEDEEDEEERRVGRILDGSQVPDVDPLKPPPPPAPPAG